MVNVVGVLIVVLVVIWAAQRSLIYFPESDVPSPGAIGLPGAEIVSYETEAGLLLHAWFSRALRRVLRLPRVPSR